MPLPKSDNRTDEQRKKHCENMKRYYKKHEEQRDKLCEKLKEKYKNDEEYRTMVKNRAKLRRIRLRTLKQSETVITNQENEESQAN